jgi:hypothetical protein
VGHPQPVTVRDPDFKMVQVRANGLCVVKIADAEIFLREVIGTDSAVEADEITELLRRSSRWPSPTWSWRPVSEPSTCRAARSSCPRSCASSSQDRVDDEFGLAIPEMTMNISLPDEITQAMTRGVARGVEEGGYVDNVDDSASSSRCGPPTRCSPPPRTRAAR